MGQQWASVAVMDEVNVSRAWRDRARTTLFSPGASAQYPVQTDYSLGYYLASHFSWNS
jgi:hypothetical protein